MNVETAEEIGNVQDLLVDKGGNVTGIVMDAKPLFERDKVIPLELIKEIGTDSVMIHERKLQAKQSDNEFSLQGKKSLLGKPMFTAEGQKLGLLEDVYFDEKLGKIVGYELTDGFFADITEGRRVVQTDSPLTVSADAIVVNLKE